MKPQLLPQIEKSIEALPHEQQLKLIEKIVHRLRRELPTSNNQEQTEFERQLEKMAADFQIQFELQSINDEFSEPESDGLEKL